MKIKLVLATTFYMSETDEFTPYRGITLCVDGLVDVGLLPKIKDEHWPPKHLELQVFRKDPKKKAFKRLDLTFELYNGLETCKVNYVSKLRITAETTKHIINRLQPLHVRNIPVWVKATYENQS